MYFSTNTGDSIMQNVITRVEGNKLIIEVDLSQDFGPSSSGKTNRVADSGFATVEHPTSPGAGFKLSVWKKPAKK